MHEWISLKKWSESETHVKWISVKDKLPTQEEWVLAFTKERNIITAMYEREWWFKCKFVKSGRVMERIGDYDEVTHWALLPEPPEGVL